jgi:hypothetical protein
MNLQIALVCKNQVAGLQMRPKSGTYPTSASSGSKKRQRRGLLVFSELPRIPSTGSRGCLYGFLWAVRLFKKCEEERSNSAYSPLSDRRRLTALVEVHWARRVQAPMSQISGPNVQKNRFIETGKEEGCAVSTQERATRRENEK